MVVKILLATITYLSTSLGLNTFVPSMTMSHPAQIKLRTPTPWNY